MMGAMPEKTVDPAAPSQAVEPTPAVDVVPTETLHPAPPKTTPTTPATDTGLKLVIISGLSGAGKTVALKQYEDLGYYCIDNLPLALVPPMIDTALNHATRRYDRLALGLDARIAEDVDEFSGEVDQWRAQGADVQVLFLTSTDEALLRRYAETRRRHPLSDSETSLVEAIAKERHLLEPVAASATLVLDTTGMNLHDLREAIHARLPEAGAGKLAVQFLSFGFKNGLPDGVDFVFDARCLPNPHWVPELRPKTGQDPLVQRYFERQPEVTRYMADIRRFLEGWLPQFRDQDRAYVTVGIGCTGGKHRSVYLTEMLGRFFRHKFDQVLVKHRDMPVPAPAHRSA